MSALTKGWLPIMSESDIPNRFAPAIRWVLAVIALSVLGLGVSDSKLIHSEAENLIANLNLVDRTVRSINSNNYLETLPDMSLQPRRFISSPPVNLQDKVRIVSEARSKLDSRLKEIVDETAPSPGLGNTFDNLLGAPPSTAFVTYPANPLRAAMDALQNYIDHATYLINRPDKPNKSEFPALYSYPAGSTPGRRRVG